MGITDGKKSSSSTKSKVISAHANGCTESTLPQMVITSVEGESEELKLDNDLEAAVEIENGDTKGKNGDEVQHLESLDADKSKETSKTVIQESIYEIVEPKNNIAVQENGLDGDHIVEDHSKSPKESEGFFAKSKGFWKHDGKPLFSFPKFSFGSKESKESKKSEKVVAQEYSIEAAEAFQELSSPPEHYKKIDEDASNIVNEANSPTTKVSKQDSFKSVDRASMIHPTSGKSSDLPAIHRAEEECFDLPDESHIPHRAIRAIRASTPESLYGTCCIKLASLLRHKAVEIASDSTKIIPPKKPPKPSAEAVAKARAELTTKRLQEFESRQHALGEDFSIGFHGIRYADEDTESSNDYRDVDNYGVVLNPECYGIIRKLKSDDADDTFRAPSTCSGMTSYYTADSITLKDENSSDNTLETVSLGSYDSIICRPEKKVDVTSPSLPATLEKKSSQSCGKKVPPPVPPKPSPTLLLKSCKNTDAVSPSAVDVSRCVNTLSLSPRPVHRPLHRTTNITDGIKKRPLTIAGVKTTEFDEFVKKDKPETPTKTPVLNTVVKNKSLKSIRNLPVEPKGMTKSFSFSSRDRTPDSTVKAATPKPQPPPRPPPPTCKTPDKQIVKETQKSEETESTPSTISPPPRKALVKLNVTPQRPVPPATKPVVSSLKSASRPPRPPPPAQKPTLSDTKVIESNVLNEKVEEITFVLHSEDTNLGDKSSCVESSEVSKEISHITTTEISKNEESPAVLDLKISSDTSQDIVPPVKTIFPPARRSRPPRPPPRLHRPRSRTVESVKVTEDVPEVRRRSQSLSDIEIELHDSPPLLLSPKDAEIKALYTAVNKNAARLRTVSDNLDNEDRLSSSSDVRSSRPLPAPPPPPRSKSHSTSRRCRSDERPSSSPRSILQEESSITKAESMPSELNGNEMKPPTRRRKTEREKFFSLRRVDNDEDHPIHKVRFSSLKNTKDIKGPPIKPERRMKHSPTPKFDENANIAEPGLSHFYFEADRLKIERIETPPPPVPSRHRVRSMGYDLPKEESASPAIKRSKSESGQKHSLWYDDEIDFLNDASSKGDGSWENINLASESSSYQNVKRSPQAKSSQQTSTFYVEMEEEQSQRPSSVSTFDKETSPFPLECSEKSVQTSLETLSIGRTSQAEVSEDTDDLLDLAQTLQNELKTIIDRNKNEKSRRFSEESSDSSAFERKSSKKKVPIVSAKPRPPLESTTSSASELWQISSSSEESESECIPGKALNLSDISRSKKEKKIFYIAQEIMSSEEAFVDALKLLNVDFRAFIEEYSKQKGTSIIPDEMFNQIVNHLPQLLHLNENLFLELKYRIEQWDSVHKIADVIVKMGPFLKLYSWYIQDFEATVSLLEEAKKKFPLFALAVRDFEGSPRCKRLTLNHYMLKPVQRIPQYRLLLQEYLHHLTVDSADHADTLEALKIVSEVANHANESMRHGDNFQKLMSIQSSIIGHKEIIKPGRMFIKEGELMKLSRKGMQSRWFVLLNDLLLYLTPVQQGLYRVNHELTLAGMKVAIPLQQDYQNEFSIISVTRSFTLIAKSPEERQEWIDALTKAIEENASKRSTFTAVRLLQKSEQSTGDTQDPQGFILGKTAPVWIPDARVTMCQLCTSEFTVTFRRHHCRACGKVVCSICSSNRISLPYLGNRIARVCDECYPKLGQAPGSSSGCTESAETDSDNQHIAGKPHLRMEHRHKKPKRQLPSVLKEVCANDVGSTISGYVYKRSNNSWKKSWFVIKDKVLYEFKASEDVAALKSLPLLGFQINTFTEPPYEGVDPSLVFEISHPGQVPVVFRTETLSAAEKWIKELKEATVLE